MKYSALNDEPVVLHSYRPSWRHQFRTEARWLTRHCSTVFRLEHIGSTSIPGLSAKPIVDMLAGVANNEQAISLVAELRDCGYVYYREFETEIPDRRFLIKRNCCGERIYHMSVVIQDSLAWRRHMDFKHCLAADSDAGRRYVQLKRQLERMYGTDRKSYGDLKSDFVRVCLSRGPRSAESNLRVNRSVRARF